MYEPEEYGLSINMWLNSDGEDIIYFQGHISPGIYSRSFLEGRFNDQDLKNFRQEILNHFFWCKFYTPNQKINNE